MRIACWLRRLAPLAVLLVPETLPAQGPDDPLPVDPAITVGVLDNGLRYYIRANDEPENRAELRLVVDAGSVLEADDQRGLAHFVEHMAFNGTEHFPKQALVEYLEGIGMQFGPEINAYTSFDETVYMLTVPTDSAELLRTAFQILEDWAHGQLLDHEEIDRERGVILEEWRLGRGAGARMRDQQLPIVFHGSVYAERLPIGHPEVIESFAYETLELFYRDWYRPDLMAVVAVGDFGPAAVEALIREHFEDIPAQPEAPARPEFPVPDHDETLFAIATDLEATNTDVSVYFKLPLRQQGTLGAYRQSLVERLYNRMLNQRLFELTQRPDAPYLAAFSDEGGFVRTKEVYSLGALVPAGGAAVGLEALLTEAERVARHGFTPSELARTAREMMRDMEQVYAERENTESASFAAEYTRNFLTDEPIPGIEAEFELTQLLVPGIRLDEVNGLARAWVTDRNRVVVVGAPEQEGVAVPDEGELADVFDVVAAKEIAPYEDAAADEPLVAEVPAGAPIVAEERVEELGLNIWELANGVRVLLKPTDFRDDEVLMRAWSPGGISLASDEDDVSATMATSAVQMQGIGPFSMIDLQKALAGKAVEVGPFVDELYEGVAGSVSPQDLQTMFELTYLYFTAPRVDSLAFLAMQQQMRAFFENRSASPDAAFSDTLQVTLAQHHPRLLLPSPELFDELDLGRSMAFYRDRFADGSDFTFAFVGAFDPDSIRPLVETYLGGLPSTGREESWRDLGVDPPTGVVERTVYRGVEPRSRTAIVFTGPWDYSRESRHLQRSVADVLQIRLRELLREDLGGTYSVSVSSSTERYPDGEYSFQVAFGCDPERVDELVGVVFATVDTLRTVGPDAEDLRTVQEIQRRSRETSLEQNGYWVAQLAGYEQLGDDLRGILEYEALIDGLTVDAVRETAVTILRPDNYVRVTLYPESMR